MRCSQPSVGRTLGYLVVTLLATLLLTSCTIQLITPVPDTDGSPSLEATAPAEAEAETPEPPASAVADAVAVDTANAEAAEDVAAPPLSHALARHEACVECHAVDSGREPAPADHAGFIDAICLYCHMPEEGEAAIPALPTKAQPDFCLGCHGPSDELTARTAEYTLEGGLAGNPHMPIPHDKDKPSSCANCHEVHALPVTPAVAIETADLTYCFAACHHEQTFEPCSDCHEE